MLNFGWWYVDTHFDTPNPFLKGNASKHTLGPFIDSLICLLILLALKTLTPQLLLYALLINGGENPYNRQIHLIYSILNLIIWAKIDPKKENHILKVKPYF